ncbi:hypothetical protein EVAR_79191_1 [Eumeta japonica]|uniref:Uncharacterized protein n=1 Tax=Eumeta variegata TaxID=151549 RepID=A0A4C1UUH2_EUMVA|nr:hypothetical protein EVAR_79191_1 [Eumeta japonica]
MDCQDGKGVKSLGLLPPTYQTYSTHFRTMCDRGQVRVMVALLPPSSLHSSSIRHPVATQEDGDALVSLLGLRVYHLLSGGSHPFKKALALHIGYRGFGNMNTVEKQFDKPSAADAVSVSVTTAVNSSRARIRADAEIQGSGA